MSKCAGCNGGFGDADLIAVCCVCYDLYHASESGLNCAATTSTEIRVLKLKAKPQLVYRCAKCTKNGGQNQQVVEALVELKDEVKLLSSFKEAFKVLTNKTIPEFRQDIDELKSQSENLKTDLADHIEKNTVVIENFKVQLSAIEATPSCVHNADSNNTAMPTAAFQAQMVLSEIDNRKARENNLIILNVPECPVNANSKTKKSHDLNYVVNILSKIKNISTKLNNKIIKRIGTYNPDQKRIIRVKIDCHNDVSQVLIHWRLIPKEFIVSADLTQNQRECLRSLKKVAEEFNLMNKDKNNNTKKIVKFIKGNPTLVTVKDKKKKN